MCIRDSSKTVREFLEKNYKKDEPPASEQDCVKLAIKSLLEVVQTGARNIEITVVKPNSIIANLTTEEISTYVDEIEAEKQLDLDKKKQQDHDQQ